MEKQKIVVVNVNRKGEVFDPGSVVVRRDEHPELFQFLDGRDRK